ncbi:MAG: AI-2E family transporter [Candidatus Eremiobacteraeota bacterium]|nr:AI-2E family transporter [Candidatus Eremiobacteraeota bacterium]
MKQSGLLSSPEVSTLVRAGLWLSMLAAGIWFLTRIQVTLGIFGLAWLIAYLTRPAVLLFEGKRVGPIRKCPRSLAIFTVYFLLLTMLFVAGSLALPTVTGQFDKLLDLQHALYHPQELAAAIQNQGERLVNLVPMQYRAELLDRLKSSVGNLTVMVGQGLTEGLGFLATFFKQLAAGAAVFISSLLISLYLLFGWEDLYKGTISAFPGRYRHNFIELIAKMNQIFGGYVRATILASVVNALGTLAGLTLFSLFTGRACPYTYLISLVAGLTYPIPLFGILSSVITAVILGFLPESDIATGLLVGGVVAVVSISIDRLVTPKLMGDAIGVSPMFVIFAAAAGGEFLGGVWGMLLGIPLAAMTKAFFLWFHDLFLVDPTARDLAPGGRDGEKSGEEGRAHPELPVSPLHLSPVSPPSPEGVV